MAPQREWFEKDYYKVLGVAPTAPTRRSRAPTASSRRAPPRRQPRAPRRASRRSAAAYDVLGDAEKRKEYDEVRRPAAGRRLRPAAGAGGGTVRMEDMGDLGDLFGGLFGGGGPDAHEPAGPQRGADMEAQLHLSFHDAVHGVTTSVNVPQEVRARTAAAAAPRRARSTHTCRAVAGRAASTTTRACSPSARSAPTAWGGARCSTRPARCHGTGTEQKVRSVKVRIPPGVEGGQRIRVKGRGAPGQGMAPRRRPLRGRARRPPRGVRAQRAGPDHQGADHLPGGRARARRSRCRRSTARSR